MKGRASDKDAVASLKPSASTMDKLIESLKGPKVISTVTKSSSDWDQYKEKEGIDDDQLQAAKNGYLAKKEFLERCDVRSYENEKEIRLSSQQK